MVFVDESKIKIDNKGLIVIGSLVITKKSFKRIINDINKHFGRLEELPEVHFSEISRANHKILSLAKFYINHLSKACGEEPFFINLIICDQTKLKQEFGKGSEFHKNVEKRFTRLAVTFSINKYVRRFKETIVKVIAIDEGGKADDFFFRKYNIQKIRSKTKAKLPDSYLSIESDPRKEAKKDNGYPEYSIFIDIIDLIIGAFRSSVMHDAKNKNKIELTDLIFNKILLYLNFGSNSLIKLNIYPKDKKQKEIKQKILKNLEEIQNIKKTRFLEPKNIKKKVKPAPYTNLNKFFRVN